jgi:hypothetical protein
MGIAMGAKKLPLDSQLELAAVLLRVCQGLLDPQMGDCAAMVGYVADDLDLKLRRENGEAKAPRAKPRKTAHERRAPPAA